MALGNATSANATNLQNVLKYVWTPEDMQNLFYEDSPLLAMLPKAENMGGRALVVPVQYGQINGRSSTLADAISYRQPSKVVEMQITAAENFANWRVTHRLIALSRNDKMALVRAVESQTKSAFRKFKRSVCMFLYGNGGGAAAKVAASGFTANNVATNKHKVTLADARYLRNLEVGDVVKWGSDDGTTAGYRTGTGEVYKIDPDGPYVYIDTTGLTNQTDWASGDYIFVSGDNGYVNGGNNLATSLTLKGLETYVPSSTPTTSLWGMDRTLHTTKLGGIRVGGKGLLIHEAIKKALKKAADEGASISHVFMSTTDFMNLELALGTQKRYADEKVGSVGFTGIEFTSGSKMVKVFADADCPTNVIWGLQMNTWKLDSAGAFPDWITAEGTNKFQLIEGSNDFEGRIGGYAQLYTDAPGYNFRLDLTAA